MKIYVVFLISLTIIFAAFAGCGQLEQNISFTATILEIYDGAILVSTSDDVGFDKAQVSLDAKTRVSFDLAAGQTIRVTILPQIAESYPVQVKAVSVNLITEPEKAGYTVSFVRADGMANGGWEFVISRAVNADKSVISSVRHIPVIWITSQNELNDFVQAGKIYYQFDIPFGESKSFSETASKYAEDFFSENQLLILCTMEASGSIRHRIKDTYINKDALSIAVESIIPEVGTDDMADWFIFIEFAKDDLAGCDYFDAYYAY